MALRLSTPVSGLPGIGEKATADFASVGVKTLYDLLWYVPFRYDDFSRRSTIAGAPANTPLTIEARVVSIRVRPSKSRRVSIVDAVIEDDTGRLSVMWFNQPYLVKTLSVGSRHAFAGIIDSKFKRTLMNPAHEPAGSSVHTGRIVPVYRLTGSLTLRKVREAAQVALKSVADVLNWLPEEIEKTDGLMSLADALACIHAPKTMKDLAAATDRLKFEELFLHQLLFARVRSERRQKNAFSIPADTAELHAFSEKLPFALTHAQKRAVWEIAQDLTQDVPMNRLLEGDVGSGKSLVAVMAALLATRVGVLTVYLAPTELLAAQQHKVFSRWLADNRVALLTRSQSAINGRECKKSEVTEMLARREVDVIIGTHALLQDSVDVSQAGIVIIDEQHRFGVRQRHALLERVGEFVPHLLSMTATPIPRSLALTIYGDLDVSILDEMPKGRKMIATAIVAKDHQLGMWGHVRSQIQEGRQVYVVCPLIDPSDAFGAVSVTEMEAVLKKEALKGVRIGVLHGKMKSEEKQAQQQAFRDGLIDVLLSTTVVEVGIDVPNATVMVIMSAERFGLAQLHQLRGRVGRGEAQSYCYLLPDELGATAKARLQAVVDSQDGFALAEKDLALRGAGNVFGNAQSGFPDFQFATSADVSLMKRSRDWAKQFLARKDFPEAFPLVQTKIQEAFDAVHLE